MREKIKKREIETKSPNFPSINLDNIGPYFDSIKLCEIDF
jgi:hypothetical protein